MSNDQTYADMQAHFDKYLATDDIDEEMAERDRLRKALSDKAIREMVNEAMTDKALVDIIRRYGIDRVPVVPDCQIAGYAILDRVRPLVEEYIENELETQK